VVGVALAEILAKAASATRELCLSEVMTIVVGFHLSGYRTKDYCLNQALRNERSYFPGLVSYNRFVELLQGNAGALELFSDQPLWARQWDELD
jgi:hypothetical protein